MPVPSNLSDLSKVSSENSPQGTETVKGTIDDYIRAHASFLRQLSDLVGGPTVTLASAATVNIGFAGSANISITGTTAITAFDNVAEGTLRWVTFAGALTLTHNAASLQLPGGASIVTSAGDVAVLKSLGAGNWKCMAFQRVSSSPLTAYLPLTGGTMQGQLLLKEGTVNAPGLSFVNDGAPDTGLYHIIDGSFGISCNGMAVVKYEPNIVTHTGSLRQRTDGGSGVQRELFVGQQVNGAARFKWGLDADERPVLWTYGTSGIFDGQVHFGGGNVQASGAVSGFTVTETSDGRLKKLWRRLSPDLLQNVAKLKKVGTFVWRKDGSVGMGGSAQELEQFMPWAVHTDANGFKSVRYGAAAFVIVVELTRAFFAYVAKQDRYAAKLEKRLVKLEAK